MLIFPDFFPMKTQWNSHARTRVYRVFPHFYPYCSPFSIMFSRMRHNFQQWLNKMLKTQKTRGSTPKIFHDAPK